MNNTYFSANLTPSVSVSRSTLSDFERAFKNLKPSVTTQGNRVKIEQRGVSTHITLSQPQVSVGYTR